MKKYEIDYNDWKARMAKMEVWKQQREQRQDDASQKFTSTDYAFRLHKSLHPDEDRDEPEYSNYYTPSKDQRNGEMFFTGMAVTGAPWGILRFFGFGFEQMADGEEIPMRPVDPDPFDADGEERNPHHEEETRFGGLENHAFDPDDYQTDEQMTKARSTIRWLQSQDIDPQASLKYSKVDGTRLVSSDGRDWYEIAIGATSSGERLALSPFLEERLTLL